MEFEFKEPQIHLELSEGKIGDGWELVPAVAPTKTSSPWVATVTSASCCWGFSYSHIAQLIFILTVIYLVQSSSQILKKETDEFESGKRLPRCIFSVRWARGRHNEQICLYGTNEPVLTVECGKGMVGLL